MSKTDQSVDSASSTLKTNTVSSLLPLARALDQVALIGLNFGDGRVVRDILNDWFAFLGGKPGQVVIVDNGSPKETHELVYAAYCEGMIDKLVLIQPGHCDTGNHQVHIGAHTSAAIATKPYLLWFRLDVLPFRDGHAQWLPEAIAYLDRTDVFAVGGSFNIDSKHHEAWPGWYFSHKCSENFSLMKRSTFIAAMQEFCGEYISSGFNAQNPAAAKGQTHRGLMEVAWERYIQTHQTYTLVREEDPTWTIFHTNVHEERLAKTRKDYLARKGVLRYMNAGSTGIKPPGLYYGRPFLTAWVKQIRAQFGRSAMGPYWRAFKGAVRGK